MLIKKIIDIHSSRLTLLFLGWGMDWHVVSGLSHSGSDLAVVYDYRSLCGEEISVLIARYEEVNVVAWSFGVYAASRVLAPFGNRIGRRVAVNGTMIPVNDNFGIPRAIFDGTLANFCERSLRRFYRRMCTSATQFAEFCKCSPQRQVSELAEELACFDNYVDGCPRAHFRWDFAVVGKADAIFPPEAQSVAWCGENTAVEEVDCGHLPDFQAVLNRYIIDKHLVAERFSRAKTTYDADSQIQRMIARRLWRHTADCLAGVVPRDIIEVGSGSGLLTALYAPLYPAAHIKLWDLVDYGRTVASNAAFCCCDAESAISTQAAESADLIISASTMQWFNSSETFIRNSLRVLRAGGLLAVSTFSPENLAELHRITGVGLAVPSVENLRAMIPQNIAEILLLEQEVVNISFADVRSMLSHLSRTGVTGLHHKSPVAAVKHLLDSYPRDADGCCSLSYTPVYLIVRKKQ